MRTEVIKADSIDEAVQRILEELKEDDVAAATARRTIVSSGRRNVIYFDGWDGLGASAVLRAVGQRLAPSSASEEQEPVAAAAATRADTGLEFSQIIHIDCSKWESRMAMQRAMAEQVPELPAPVMEMFDAQDEEDNYRGLDQASRFEIPQVANVMYQHIQKLGRRFLVIFHNGSNQEIDLDSFGFPLLGYSRNKVLWSFQGRFRLYPRAKVERALGSAQTTDVLLSATTLSSDAMRNLLCEEAGEVVREINKTSGINWEAAADCFLYTLKLCSTGSRSTYYDLPTHACNYWRCDGIIRQLQQGGTDGGGDEEVDRLWIACDALYREVQLDVDYYCQALPSLPSPVVIRLPQSVMDRRSPTNEWISHWASPTYGFMLVPNYGQLLSGMFQQFDKLCVLKLSACKFSLKSAPFLCCHSLRFLWLDHCRLEYEAYDAAAKEGLRMFLQRPWVLDVRYCTTYTLWSRWTMDFMTQLRELYVMGERNFDVADLFEGRLCNVRKLRITKCYNYLRSKMNLFSGMEKMELLDLSGNTYSKYTDNRKLSVANSCSNLETVIIDGATALEEISLMGCARLQNLLLSGSFPDLHSIHITGAAVKTLDLSAVTAPRLKKLILIDSGKLCAILWPSSEEKRKVYLDKLHIDTTQKEEGSTDDGSTGSVTEARSPAEFDWYISVRDARLLGSLEPVYFDNHEAHVEISISSPTSLRLIVVLVLPWLRLLLLDGSMPEQYAYYQDPNGDIPGIMCICPSPYDDARPLPPSQGCHVDIQDHMRTKAPNGSGVTIPEFICSSAKVMHLHDSLSISSIPSAPSLEDSPMLGSGWNQLEWCRVERCPKLDCVFHIQKGIGQTSVYYRDMKIFNSLRTFWASYLPKARYIWNTSDVQQLGYHCVTFANLKLLHLHCCPRLKMAAPLYEDTWASLETIEIMWCGDLTIVLPGYYKRNSRYYPNLKHIHLHELPKLQCICTRDWKSMTTPKLETIKIRGCWSLTRLPDVKANKLVECDCEKEWWDRLKWWRRNHANEYKPIHPRYYKKTMLRGSVLR
ncbi:unnamed protein product [Urochloa decumbens]|uniref:Disease resistance protein At4g27190-like leucine-rich repeats domain-containing protein n=1 Tax=Urochloa decumbens TaxID=240449 RepID=A0ABC9B816_9POAL